MCLQDNYVKAAKKFVTKTVGDFWWRWAKGLCTGKSVGKSVTATSSFIKPESSTNDTTYTNSA
jgi:hypothetical protein